MTSSAVQSSISHLQQFQPVKDLDFLSAVIRSAVSSSEIQLAKGCPRTFCNI